jgi:acyl-CoA dehydrogenase
MLLMMKSLTQAARCLSYTAAATLDMAHSAVDETQRIAAARRVDLLTPLVKAWCSDVGVEVASLGVQIHGGTGYVDDAEISQIYRDARIGPIFEGTNYIQAQDLLGRKIIRDRGVAFAALITDIETAARGLPPEAAHPLALLRSELLDGCTRLRGAAAGLIERSASEPDLIGATAHHFLQWVGVLAGGWQWALCARRALSQVDAGAARAVIDTAAFYSAQVLPRMHAHEAAVRQGAGPVTRPAVADL